MPPKSNEVDVEAARRIAIHAQALDGSAGDVLETVKRLGFLQLDPIATVATPQELVVWSRLGSFDRSELDRLLWDERALFEWNAFVWPIESLPMVRGLMRRWRTSTHYAHERWGHEFIAANKPFRRYVLRELEQRGPLLSRDLEDKAAGEPRNHRWYGSRRVALMLMVLHLRGEVAIAGRRGKQRLWDLAERWYPPTVALTLARANKMLDEQRFRALGVRLEKGRLLAHSDADDSPVPDRVTLLSPFDRLIHDRDRAEMLFDFHYRLEMYVTPAKREYGYYVLPLLDGERIAGRAEPVLDRKTNTMRLLGAWGDTSRLDEALTSLASFLGATPPARSKPTRRRASPS
jgi:uncharacterized protein YcaQ